MSFAGSLKTMSEVYRNRKNIGTCIPREISMLVPLVIQPLGSPPAPKWLATVSGNTK